MNTKNKNYAIVYTVEAKTGRRLEKMLLTYDEIKIETLYKSNYSCYNNKKYRCHKLTIKGSNVLDASSDYFKKRYYKTGSYQIKYNGSCEELKKGKTTITGLYSENIYNVYEECNLIIEILDNKKQPKNDASINTFKLMYEVL